MDQQQLLDLIALAESDWNLAKERRSKLRHDLMEVESVLIESKLRKERLQEELRLLRLSSVSVEIDEREQEIAAFKQRLPDLLDKA